MRRTAFGPTAPRSGRGAARVLAWLGVAAAVPAAALAVVAWIPVEGVTPQVESGGSKFASGAVSFTRQTIGPQPGSDAWITNVKIVHFDDDGLPDVLVCDAKQNKVFCYLQVAGGGWEERLLGSDLLVPAHASLADLDGDAQQDVLVAELGNIWPDDGVIGRVVLLRNEGERFERHVLLDDVRRVSDVQAGDITGDDQLDLVVSVFGYARGQILWLENLGDLRFREHELLSAPGTIHVPLADYDGDGDLDIAAIVSQDEEELWCFENLGNGEFRPRRIWFTPNFDLGSAGLVQSDLDGDGRPDLILPVGDNLEDLHSYPQPYHGCLWFRNRGDWQFEVQRIARFGGTYAAAVGDIDGDGHLDVTLVSMFNDWDRHGHASVVWLQNDGRQNFRTWQIDDRPTHLVTVACGDVDGDGRADIVAGGLHLTGPDDRVGRVTAWTSRGRQE